jgi:predicted ATP-grasp superfamily ATP-dependent carboligase
MISQLEKSQKPDAIVVGLDYVSGLQSARILARRNIPVIGIATNPGHFGCRTRVCKKIFIADDGEAILDTLEELGPTLQHKAVLIPCEDQHVLLISRNRKRLERWYHIVLPDPEVVEMLMDKISFYDYAQRHEFPIPKTFILRNKMDANEAAEQLTFPCVVKPPGRSPEWSRNTSVKAFKVRDAATFLAIYERCQTWADAIIAQEWIEGTDADLYSCNCYFNASCESLVTFIARKLRQWPPEAGDSCLGEECRNDVVLNETVRLFQSVGYRGLGYLELKRDARSKNYFIVEPNIGRPTGRSAIAEAGGVERLYTMYCDATGLPLPESREQRYKGVKWIQFRKDCQSAIHYWRNGQLTFAEWWRSWQGRKAYAVFSWSDPAPFLADLINAARTLFSARKRRKRNFRNPAGHNNGSNSSAKSSRIPSAQTSQARSEPASTVNSIELGVYDR